MWNYIAKENARAAVQMDQLFSDAAARLAEYPHLGRPDRISGTREPIAHDSYRLGYEIAGETLWVLALVHTPRRWPPERK